MKNKSEVVKEKKEKKPNFLFSFQCLEKQTNLSWYFSCLSYAHYPNYIFTWLFYF